jgi:hypothetical protein
MKERQYRIESKTGLRAPGKDDAFKELTTMGPY